MQVWWRPAQEQVPHHARAAWIPAWAGAQLPQLPRETPAHDLHHCAAQVTTPQEVVRNYPSSSAGERVFNPFTAKILLENDCESAKLDLLKPLFFFPLWKIFIRMYSMKVINLNFLTSFFLLCERFSSECTVWKIYLLYMQDQKICFQCVYALFLAEKFYRLGMKGQPWRLYQGKRKWWPDHK